MAFSIPEAPSRALLDCIGFKCQCTQLARGKPSFSTILLFINITFIHVFEGHPWQFKEPYHLLFTVLTHILSQWAAFCSRSASIRFLWIFHICSSCHLLFWRTPLCPQGGLRLLKENLEESWQMYTFFFFWLGGELRGEGGGAHCCRLADKGVEKFPVLERPRRTSLLIVHRFFLAMF